MSVKPATDEQIELCRGAGIPDRLTNRLIARIEAERARAEKAEALLRKVHPWLGVTPTLQKSIHDHLLEHADVNPDDVSELPSRMGRVAKDDDDAD